MPEDTPEILLNKRRNIKYLYKMDKKEFRYQLKLTKLNELKVFISSGLAKFNFKILKAHWCFFCVN